LKDVASLVSSTISRTIISQQNEETVISESWREPLRLCTTICDDHDVDAVMRAILEPAKGEGHGIARARAIQAMQCLADEPNVSEAIGKGIAEQFARHISEGDGDGHGTSIADKAALEIVSTPWVEPVRGALIAEFMDRAADVRGSAGGVASLLARSKSQDGGLARLCNELMAARASSSDIRVASVCLTIMDFAYHRSQERDPISDEETVLRNLVVQLIENLKDAKAVTHAAAWALFWLTTGHRPTEIASPLDLAPPQREVLFDFLGRGDSDVEALAYVAWIAGRTKSMDAVAPLLSRVRHEYKRLAKAAIAALGEIGGSGAVDALLGLLKDVGKDTRLAAAAALGGTGDGRAVDGLLGLLKDVDKDTRWAAAEALGRIGDSRAVDGLLGSLKDVEEDTRAATIYALGKTSDSRAVASLLGLLRDVEQSVRIAALGALATRMDATDKRLLSRDLDGFPPFRDPQDIIDDGTAVTASKLLEMDTSVIRSRYEQMAEKFGLRLGWRP
jgi:HEAT repeat protein